MDTNAAATLHVYDDPVLSASLDVVMIANDEDIGITFTVASGSVPADSFELVSVDISSLMADVMNAVPGSGPTKNNAVILCGGRFGHSGPWQKGRPFL